MALLYVVTYNPTGDEFEVPQAANTIGFNRAVHFEAAVTTDSTIDGRDLAADGTKLDFITVTGAVDLDAVNTKVTALEQALVYMGNWDASTALFPTSTNAGELWRCSVAGTVGGVPFNVDDQIFAITDTASDSVYAGNWTKIDNNDLVTSVAGKTGVVTLVEADITDLGTYLTATDVDSVAKLNALVSDTLLVDGSIDTFAELQALVADETILAATSIDTLAKLNAIVAETLIDDTDARLTDARTPTAHTHVEADITVLQSYLLAADIDTLAELNAIVADATLRDEDDTVTNTLTAYATGGQANATQLNKFINVITVCATAGDSVKLPSAEAGAECTVINKGATSADCFPNTDDVIGIKAANEAVPVSPNGTLFLKAYDSINWVVL